MSTKITYVMAEKLSEEKRKKFGLPNKGTVALEVSVNSSIKRKYVSLPKKGFLKFLQGKIKLN